MNYGAAILELLVPDRDGRVENVVLAYENMEDYNRCLTYFGMICGRTSGRIANGQFVIDGTKYTLNKNEKGISNLHGGIEGFSFKKWEFEIFQQENEAGVSFFTTSPDMEEGYPGNVQVEVKYTLNNKSELILEYKGTTDRATLLNMTNHSYFNLSGDYKRPITDEKLFIDADRL
jgi:aldose 1-epimerase